MTRIRYVSPRSSDQPRVSWTSSPPASRAAAWRSISRANAKEVLDAHVTEGHTVSAIVEARGFSQISDGDALGAIVDAVIAANPTAVADVRAGKAQAIGFLVGAVMRQTRGQANAAVVQAALKARLAPDAAGERD